VQACREQRDPAEDDHETDQLQGCERDHTEDQQGYRGPEHGPDDGGDAQDVRRVVTAADRDHRQHPEEREHDARRGALVEELVHVDRDGADPGEMETGGRHQSAEPARPLDAAQILQSAHVPSQAAGEQEDEQTGRQHRRVEGSSREVVEGAQFAEGDVPPPTIGGRDDRYERPQREQRDRQSGQGRAVHRGADRERRHAKGAGGGCRRWNRYLGHRVPQCSGRRICSGSPGSPAFPDTHMTPDMESQPQGDGKPSKRIVFRFC